MDRFVKDGIVSDVIDDVPPTCLEVKWENHTLSPGDILTPTQVKDRPVVTFDADTGSFYTLLFHDPDAPSRSNPSLGEIQHWYVANIPGNDISKGEELTAYIGSGARHGTGIHRYCFLLYIQLSGRLDVSAVSKIPFNTVEGRRHHKVRDIAKKHNLQLVAGNFYQAEWDEYVPLLHAQLQMK